LKILHRRSLPSRCGSSLRCFKAPRSPSMERQRGLYGGAIRRQLRQEMWKPRSPLSAASRSSAVSRRRRPPNRQ
jgi:hypothetical protein